MKVSTKGRYALRMMIDLAENSSGQFVALKDVSLRQGISLKYLEQIVTTLGKAGFIKSLRGPFGGYILSRDPAEYTVGAILRATEGPLAPVSCLEDEENECIRYSHCSTVDFWAGLYDVINVYVDSVTLADLVDRQKANKAPEYHI